MSRFRSGLTLVCATAALLTVSLMTPSESQAAWKVDHWIEDDGTVLETWIEDGQTRFIIVIYSETEMEIIDISNPNPDGSDDGSGVTPETIRDLAEKFNGPARLEVDLQDTYLGKLLTKQGKGLVPHYNPADGLQEDPTGGSPAGGGFNPTEGSFSSWVKKQGGSGGDDGDGDGDEPDRSEVGLFEDDMPGPPELVNPNPTLRTALGAFDQQPGGAAGSAPMGGAAPAGGATGAGIRVVIE